MPRIWKKYILWFAQEHVEFRQAEFNSVAKIFGLEFRTLSQNIWNPFWIVEFPDDETALKLASRSVSLRHIFELWSHGKTWSTFHEQLKTYLQTNTENVKQYLERTKSFKITVDSYNKHFSHREKIEKIESMDYLPVLGKVNLHTPDIQYWYIEFWGLDPKSVPPLPEDVLFGRLLAHGQRDLIKELSLKKRKFIGNTSMDAQLSLLMANQALVKAGDLVFDPFVGTGSLLVSAAKFGGYVLGADIDYMMLYARCRPSRITQRVREKDESVRANLEQYSCAHRYLDVLVADFAHPVLRHDILFDSIITDPPYGIREATEKVEKSEKKEQFKKIEPKLLNKPLQSDIPHYPSTSRYELQQIYLDLLKFAAQHLIVGGRLVCWLPFHRADYNDKMIPRHAALKLVSNSEQTLTTLTARRLLTYEKLAEPIESLTEIIETTCIMDTDFRTRYFDNGLESRADRRMRKAEIREKARQEAIKRGKVLHDVREKKCELNKARFTY